MMDFETLRERRRTGAIGGRRGGRTLDMIVYAIGLADFTDGPIAMWFGTRRHMKYCMDMMVRVASEMEMESVELRADTITINGTVYYFWTMPEERCKTRGLHFTHSLSDHWRGPQSDTPSHQPQPRQVPPVLIGRRL